MNVYDFDDTIYAGDSTMHFYRFCAKHYPKVLLALPKQILAVIGMKVGILSRNTAKELAFSYLKWVPDISSALSLFWNEHRKNLKSWYLTQKKSDDVIISASPEFVLKPICDELDVRLIGTCVDPRTGKFQGPNCRNKEKVVRFYAEYPGAVIDDFYSDSAVDTPLAELAKNAFLVKDDSISKWTFS